MSRGVIVVDKFYRFSFDRIFFVCYISYVQLMNNLGVKKGVSLIGLDYSGVEV